MTTYRLAPMKLAGSRFTLLDACGVPSTNSCAMYATKGLISIDQTAEETDSAEFLLQNADGDVEEYQSDAARVKYLKLEITFTKVTPQLINWVAGETVIYDNAASPNAIGWATDTNSATLANFALEGWTRLSGVSGCAGSSPAYGYVLWPWLVNGTFREIKHENALSDLKVTAITRTQSPWSTGPYSVNLSQAVSTSGRPWPLFTAVGAQQHRITQRTLLAPPLATTDCGLVVGTLAVVDDDAGGAGLAATATIPTPVASTTPGYIDWGDSTVSPVNAGATTATHTYLTTGLKTVKYYPSSQSDVVYTGTVTMA